jgi:hypothetical protein
MFAALMFRWIIFGSPDNKLKKFVFHERQAEALEIQYKRKW